MTGFLGVAYPWIKAAHIVFVIFWMAGLFMLPRFLVYHHEAASGSPERASWTHREQRLVAIILNPAMVMVWALGLMLVVNIGAQTELWFRFKFLIVVGLTLYQAWMVRQARRLARGEPGVSGKSLRLLNEIPGIAIIAIVILVIVRPLGS